MNNLSGGTLLEEIIFKLYYINAKYHNNTEYYNNKNGYNSKLMVLSMCR